MELKDIIKTEAWELYEKHKNYARLTNMYADTDRNHRFYNGNQWEGIDSSVDLPQMNFIKPIVKYKVGTINQNLWAIKLSAENFDKPLFMEAATQVCELLNRRASRIWEYNKMDVKCRKFAKQAAINDESIAYVTWEKKTEMPKVKVLGKNDVYYGNENDEDIQEQPYILIKQRMPVSKAQTFAANKGVSEEQVLLIKGNNANYEESGDAAKQELDDMTTIIYKLYKEQDEEGNDIVYFDIATEEVEIEKKADSGLSIYPLAHFNWESKEGSARGEGEVRSVIPTQVELNKTLVRRILTVKNTAYQQRIADVNKIANMEEVGKVGAIIKIDSDTPIEDVRKAYATTDVAQMSTDVVALSTDLLQTTRELAGAGDIATGEVNPEAASGKAILAVQAAAQMPMSEQISNFKGFLEELAMIWIEFIKVKTEEMLTLEEEVIDEETGEPRIEIKEIPGIVIEMLQTRVKIDVTPNTPFDKMAKEMTLENFLMQQMINFEEYVKSLDYDATAPKLKLEEIIKDRKEAQAKIQAIENQAEEAKQSMAMMLNDPSMQEQYMNDMEAMEQEKQGMPDELKAMPKELQAMQQEQIQGNV